MKELDARQSFAGKRVVITGGMGFIGSNLARRLLDLDANICVIDSNNLETGANEYNLMDAQDRMDIVIADIRDHGTIKSLIRDADYLFNLAGLSSHVGGMHAPLEDLEVNALAQIKILELCRQNNRQVRIVFAGTRQVYGAGNNLPVDETAPISPVDHNGVSKLAGELYHLLASRIYGIWAVSLRLTNTYGPRMRIKDARQTFLGVWIRQLLEQQPLTIFGNGEQIRDFNHVDDVINALLLCTTDPRATGKVYNLGDEPHSLQQVANLLIKLNGRGSSRLEPFPPERIKIDIGDYTGNYSRIKTDLGWRPQIDLEQGLKQTLAFFRAHKEHYV